MSPISWKPLRYGLIVGLILTFVLTVTQLLSWSIPVLASHRPGLQDSGSMLVAQNGLGDNLDAIARATTVFIGPDLEKDSFARNDISEYSGSGVIFAKQLIKERVSVYSSSGTASGDIQQYNYYILTNAHVVADETVYGVRVNDGEVYRVDDSFEYKEQFKASPVASNIYRFGTAIDDQGNYNGTDLAIVKFVSSKSYPVATTSSVGDVTSSSQVLISGWPLPETAERSTRSRFSRYGQLVDREESNRTNGGYSLKFNVSGMSNMSGGPVFNADGKLIAIYGEGNEEEGYGIPVENLINSLQNQENYRKAFIPTSPVVSFSNTIDPLAIAQGQTQPLKADNISEDEFSEKFGLLDVLSRDPEYQAIQSLKQRYDCMNSYRDGTFRPKVFQVKGALFADINQCLDRILEVMTANLYNTYVTRSQLQELQEMTELIAQDIADLQHKITQRDSTAPSSLRRI